MVLSRMSLPNVLSVHSVLTLTQKAFSNRDFQDLTVWKRHFWSSGLSLSTSRSCKERETKNVVSLVMPNGPTNHYPFIEQIISSFIWTFNFEWHKGVHQKKNCPFSGKFCCSFLTRVAGSCSSGKFCRNKLTQVAGTKLVPAAAANSSQAN